MRGGTICSTAAHMYLDLHRNSAHGLKNKTI
jgi:hypothetical protein